MTKQEEFIKKYLVTSDRVIKETVMTPNGNMRFKTHFSNSDNSIFGWYVMD